MIAQTVVDSLRGAPYFVVYFAAASVSLLIFCAIYLRVTPFHEVALIREGKTAPAVSFGGAILGYVLPVASAIIHSMSLFDLAIWAAIALVVQIAVFFIIWAFFAPLVKQIAEDKLGPAVFVAVISLAAGILNAACMVS
jgi:putative membrane protein